MKIVIDIPEKEFGIDINNKFQDFFSRLKAEIKMHLITNTNVDMIADVAKKFIVKLENHISPEERLLRNIFGEDTLDDDKEYGGNEE